MPAGRNPTAALHHGHRRENCSHPTRRRPTFGGGGGGFCEKPSAQPLCWVVAAAAAAVANAAPLPAAAAAAVLAAVLAAVSPAGEGDGRYRAVMGELVVAQKAAAASAAAVIMAGRRQGLVMAMVGCPHRRVERDGATAVEVPSHRRLGDLVVDGVHRAGGRLPESGEALLCAAVCKAPKQRRNLKARRVGHVGHEEKRKARAVAGRGAALATAAAAAATTQH